VIETQKVGSATCRARGVDPDLGTQVGGEEEENGWSVVPRWAGSDLEKCNRKLKS
jgi:hypothetical protein